MEGNGLALARTEGTSRRLGAYALLQAAGSLLAQKRTPERAVLQLLLPLQGEGDSASEKESREVFLEEVARESRAACENLGMELAALEVETLFGLSLPQLVAVCQGGPGPAGQEPPAIGRELVFLGTAGLTGALQLLEENRERLSRRLPGAFLREAENLYETLYRGPALLRSQSAGEGPFYPVGEGGVLGALWEFLEAHGGGMEIRLDRIPLCQETVEVCEALAVNPYQLTSGGSFLLAAEEGEALAETLQGLGCQAACLGRITKGPARILRGGRETRFLDKPAPDALVLWRQLGRAAKHTQGRNDHEK